MRFHDIKPEQRRWTRRVCEAIATGDDEGCGAHRLIKPLDRGDVLACAFAANLCLRMSAATEPGTDRVSELAEHAGEQLARITRIVATHDQAGLETKLERLAVTSEAMWEIVRDSQNEGNGHAARVVCGAVYAITMGRPHRLASCSRAACVVLSVNRALCPMHARIAMVETFTLSVALARKTIREFGR